MPILLIVIVVAVLLALFEFAALRWGYDSRDNFRRSRDGFLITRR
jgi:hypothetical protein